MKSNLEFTGLADLKQGAAITLFDKALHDAILNILDPNYPADRKREVSLSVRMMPDKDRRDARIEIECALKLPNKTSITTRLFIGMRNGQVLSAEEHRDQLPMFEKDANQPAAKITAIHGGKP